MAKNVEIKARVDSIDVIEQDVARLANLEPNTFMQDDTFYDCKNGRLKLRKFDRNRGELIFYQRADQQGPKESFYLITNTSEPDKLNDLLSHAYEVIGQVKKQRTLYKIGRTRVHLDRVKQLGEFIELEVVLDDNERLENGLDEAKSIMRQLNIQDEQLIKGAYVDMSDSDQIKRS